MGTFWCNFIFCLLKHFQKCPFRFDDDFFSDDEDEKEAASDKKDDKASEED